jgi:hypothetical protein
MFFLKHIYQNNIGSSFYLKDDINSDLSMDRIQIIIGDVALILNNNEIYPFLEVINSVKNGCKYEECHELKQITCNTSYTKLIFKSDKENIIELKDLVKGTIFELQLNTLIN